MPETVRIPNQTGAAMSATGNESPDVMALQAELYEERTKRIRAENELAWLKHELGVLVAKVAITTGGPP